MCRTSRPTDTEQCNTNPCPVHNSQNSQNPKCVQDGSFFCHGNTNYCHVKGYRELCCKTCENWRPENAKAAVEDDSRLNIDGFQEGDDFDEDDEDINELDYEELDLDVALGQLDNDMAQVDVNKVDMEGFKLDWSRMEKQHKSEQKRGYSAN